MTPATNMSVLFFGMDVLYDTEKVISPGFFVACPWIDGDGIQACFFMRTVALALRKYGFVTPESRYWFHQGYPTVKRELFKARNSTGLAHPLPIHAALVNALNSHMPPEYPTAIVMLEDVMKALEHYDIVHRRSAVAAATRPPAPTPVQIAHPENGQLLPAAAAPVLQPATQAAVPGSSWNNVINIDDGEEIVREVPPVARSAQVDLQMTATNAPVEKRRDSGNTVENDSEIGPNQPVNNSPAPQAAGQYGGAAVRPSTSSNDSTHSENPRKRRRNGPATMPGLPTSYSAPPRPFDANTQVKRAIGNLDKFDWMDTFTSNQSIPEPGQGPTKRQRKNPGSGKAKKRAVRSPENDHSSPAVDGNQGEAEVEDKSLEDLLEAAMAEDNSLENGMQAMFDNQKHAEAEDTSFDDMLRAVLTEFNNQEDGVQATVDTQTTSDNNAPLLEDALQAAFDEDADIEALQAEFLAFDDAYPDDGELILEDYEEVAQRNPEASRRETEEQEAVFAEYLRLQEGIDRQTEDAEESEDDDEDEMNEAGEV